MEGLLYSQIGYDIGDDMKAYFRSDDRNALSKPKYVITSAKGNKKIAKGKVKYFGEKWHSHWWVIDFSGIDQPMKCRLKVKDKHTTHISDKIKIGYNLLFNKTIIPVGLDAFEERSELARNKRGWKDCGSNWREVSSHTPAIIGLCDLLNTSFEQLSDKSIKRIRKQIMIGCDFVCSCMEISHEFGMPKGSIAHEIPNYMVFIPGDLGTSVVALTKSAKLICEIYPKKAKEYIDWAIAGYEYIIGEMKPFGSLGFLPSQHGLPEGTIPPDEFMTRDLLTFMWGGVELWGAGFIKYEENVVEYADMIMNRQIKKDEAVDSLYGQFNTFDSLKVSEKTYIHHHVGHDTGGIFPHYILPFITIARNWFNHPNNARWRRTIHDFAYGYLLPACKANPFMIIPVGYFENQGLLNFCGPWHGFNATLAFGAKLAMEIGGLLGDDEFTSIAVANIQWICGLNSGIKKSMLDSCVFWDEDIPDDKYESYSQILGMGKRAVGGWTKMKGTIPNGFCVNPQFEFKIEPTLKNDAPIRYTDEDWIPHSGGYISAVSAMSSSHLFRKLLCDD